MSKKNEKGIFFGIRDMAIAKRITLLYGGIFSVTVVFLSVLLMLNISSLQQTEMRRDLIEVVEDIQLYLDSGEKLSDEVLRLLLDDKNKYAEVSVFSYAENKMYNNYMGEVPPFILHPNRMQPKELERPEEMMHAMPSEENLMKEGYRIDVKREYKSGNKEYILQNEFGEHFMLLFNHYKTGDDLYRIQVFKMIGSGGYLFQRFFLTMVLLDILGICCAFLIGRNISNTILRPVEKIRSAAERISIEDLSQRISTDGPDDEMKELTITFNSMIDRLDTSFQKQNQFISDASHELRTPISVIQGYANLINRWGKSNPDVLQESIDSILTETEHMSALIRQLLFLAKGDQNRMLTQKAVISLNEVTAELVRDLKVLNVDRKISFIEEDKVKIFADYDLIKQLLWIHGENALKYSEEGDEVTIRVWKDKKYGYVSIQDQGVGIAEEDIPKIFDRFYRVDKSRNKEISGTGLGLAIARWIADCHDAEILVESIVGEGTTFTDRFLLYIPEEKQA